jgi:hypothetical protein
VLDLNSEIFNSKCYAFDSNYFPFLNNLIISHLLFIDEILIRIEKVANLGLLAALLLPLPFFLLRLRFLLILQ